MAAHTLRGSRRGATSASAIRSALRELTGSARDYDPLIELVDESRFALIGEASHGTHEFYEQRAQITKRLVLEKGFRAIAIEGDWPDAYRVDRYVRGLSGDASADAALSGFKRFPTWMWRNTVVRDFVEWLRAYNRGLPGQEHVGFYGMDLYSLFSSMDAVLAYLDRVDPEAAKRARYRYACFDHYGEDTQAYGYAASFGMGRSCEDQMVAQLTDMLRRAGEHAANDSRAAAGARFYAEQNARLVKNAEEYYRTMFRGRVSSWNIRDRHMVETLQALDAHLGAGRAHPRIVVWAHNSHLGDASTTEMGQAGEWNVGQLVRERFRRDAALIGFSTHHGSVSCASDWGGNVETKRVRPGLPDSYEALFHEVGVPRFLLTLRDNAPLKSALEHPLLQRAIGVIYLPQTERLSHYFHARITRQFDAVVHLDETRALEPLKRGPAWRTQEAPETYPSGV